MKRFLALALILSISTLGFVGCAEKAETTTTTTTKTPEGTQKETHTDKVEKTGDAKTP